MKIRLKELILRVIDRMTVVRAVLGNLTRTRKTKPLEIAGLTFGTPLGTAPGCDTNASFYNTLASFGASFVIVGPTELKPSDRCCGVHALIKNLKERRCKAIIGGAVNCCRSDHNTDSRNIETTFAMLYDFVDFIVLCPDADKEMSTIDESFTDIADNVLSLRLFYEQYKPLFLRIPTGISISQIEDLLLYCLSSGIDGVVVDKQLVAFVKEKSESRLTIMATVDSQTDTASVNEILADGASLIAFSTCSSERIDISLATFRHHINAAPQLSVN